MNFLQKQLYNPVSIGLAILLLIAGLFGVLWVLVPPPPKTITMATGLPTGLYYHFGERLKSALADEGVTLKLESTGGSIDNLALLGDPKSGVDFAMVQGGVANLTQYPQLISIAGMFYEPIGCPWKRDGVYGTGALCFQGFSSFSKMSKYVCASTSVASSFVEIPIVAL